MISAADLCVNTVWVCHIVHFYTIRRFFVVLQNIYLMFFLYLYVFLLQAEEANNLSKLMMSKKTKRLYGRMQHGIEEKKAAIRTLESKREEHEKKTNTAAKPAAAKGKKGGK